MPRPTATQVAGTTLETHRHNERIQVMVSVKDGSPRFDHLKVYGVEHLVTQDGAVVKAGSDLVQICDVNHQDLPPEIFSALMAIYHWADGLDHAQPTPEQADRVKREQLAAEAAAEEAAATAKAKAEDA